MPPPVTTPCLVGDVPATVELGEGSRAVISLAPSGDGVALEVAMPPMGWSATVDATTNKLTVRAPYGAEGNATLSLTARCGKQSQQKDLTLHAHKASWTTVATWPIDGMPSPRQMPVLWVDDASPDRMLMFGGNLFLPTQGTPASDFWSLDLTQGTWSLVQQPPMPPMQGVGRLAPAGNNSVLMFGGGDQVSIPDDVWRLDYSAAATWTKLTASDSAGVGRMMGGFVRDEKRGRYLSLFGISNVDYSNQVFAFSTNGDGSGGAWSELQTADDHGARPTARYGFSYVLDPETDRLIVFSGGQEPTATDTVNAADDLWALELKESPPRWVKLNPAGTAPAARRNAAFAYDSVGHRLIVWGGTDDAKEVITDVAVLDLDRGAEAWHYLASAPTGLGRSSGSGTFDSKRNRVLFGFGNSRTMIFTDVQALQL